jgi:hypothetical protein
MNFSLHIRRDEETGDWRRLCNEELPGSNRSAMVIGVAISRRIRCEGHVASMKEKKNVYRILVGKYERKGNFKIPTLGGKNF